jgi:hypothetical protein
MAAMAVLVPHQALAEFRLLALAAAVVERLTRVHREAAAQVVVAREPTTHQETPELSILVVAVVVLV